MKIIFILTRSITFNTFLLKQANFFISKGINVEVACSDDENLNFKPNSRHKINFPNKISNLFNILNYFKIFKQINSLVIKNPKAIFYLHTPIASHFFRFFTFFQKLQIIYFIHGFRFTSKTKILKKFFFIIIERVLSLNTGIFITINNEDYKFARSNFFKKKTYKINGVGIKLSGRHFVKKIKRKKKIKKILVVAAYKKEKGYLDLLKVAELIKKTKINIYCFGYGDCSLFNKIKLRKNLDNIFFNSFDQNLEKKIQNYDVLLHLSKREGLPVAVMQSLSKGLPVVCYNIRGNNDLIKNNYNGFFVKSFGDVPKIISYLNSNVSNYNKIQSNSYKSINKDFSINYINLNILKIIKNYSNQN